MGSLKIIRMIIFF